MKTLYRIAATAATIAALWVLIAPAGILPTPRSGYGFLAPGNWGRMNIVINADPTIPVAVWESEQWRCGFGGVARQRGIESAPCSCPRISRGTCSFRRTNGI